MEIKRYFTLTNIFIVIFSLTILWFIFQIGGTLTEIYSNRPITISNKLDLVSIYSSLIVVLISIISIIINSKFTRESIEQTNKNISDNQKYNEKSINQTNQLIKQNENNFFIQLRYEKAHRGINDLLKLIDLTIGIYKQIQYLNKRDIPEKNEYLTPRAFLIMQFINIISNYELMIKLPITLRIKLETDLINKYDENASKKINDDEKFSELLNELEFINDYKEQYQIIKSSPPTYKIKNSIKYNQFIKEFNKYEDYEMHENMFMWYYGFKKIKTEDIFNHFNNLREEIVSNSIDYLILKDKFE